MASKRRKKAKRVEALIIDRSRWLRGNIENSTLLDKEGNMCCLGFYSLALGLSKKDILGVDQPDNAVRESCRLYPGWLVCQDYGGAAATNDANRLMEDNDAVGVDSRSRERKIARAFKEHGVVVKFVGKGRPEGSPQRGDLDP